MARWTGVVVVSLNMIAQLIFIPAYPLWSLAIFTLDVLVIYGLVAYGGRPAWAEPRTGSVRIRRALAREAPLPGGRARVLPAALVHRLIGEDPAVRTLDPRLVSRTRAARPLLVADAAMGIATAAPVIVQATVLAGVVTRAFGRDPSARLGAAAAVLVAAFAVRGALAWGMEVAGRRAAASVLSELRLDLAGRQGCARSRWRPTACSPAR